MSNLNVHCLAVLVISLAAGCDTDCPELAKYHVALLPIIATLHRDTPTSVEELLHFLFFFFLLFLEFLLFTPSSSACLTTEFTFCLPNFFAYSASKVSFSFLNRSMATLASSI